MEKEKKKREFEFVVFGTTRCKHPYLCVSLLGRGDRVIGLLPLVRGGDLVVNLFGRGVGYWLLYWLRAYPSVVRWLFERGVWYS